MTTANTSTKPAQIRLTRRTPASWRVTIDNPPINVMGPEMVRQFQEVIDALEGDSVIRNGLGADLAREFIRLKRMEWTEYSRHVSDWESKRYLEFF